MSSRLIAKSLEVNEQMGFGCVIAYFGIVDSHRVDAVVGTGNAAQGVEHRGGTVHSLEVGLVGLGHRQRVDGGRARFGAYVQVKHVGLVPIAERDDKTVYGQGAVEQHGIAALAARGRHGERIGQPGHGAGQPALGVDRIVERAVYRRARCHDQDCQQGGCYFPHRIASSIW